MSRNRFSQLKVQSHGQLKVQSRGREPDHSCGCPSTTQVCSYPGSSAHTVLTQLPTPLHTHYPHSDKHKEEFQCFIGGGTLVFIGKERGSLKWGGLEDDGVMHESWGQVGGSPQKMTVDCISGRPTPTARFWKPAHVTTWLALCSLMQRGDGDRDWRWEGDT